MAQRLGPDELRLYCADLTRFSARPKVFVETGTEKGATLAAAVNSGLFVHCFSVDVVPAYVEVAQARYAERADVDVFSGSSPVILANTILPALASFEAAVLFWLDAHYQGLGSWEADPAYGQCPVLAELAVIRAAIESRAFVAPPLMVIDDAHVFIDPKPPFERGQWPTREQLRDALPRGYGLVQRDGMFECRWGIA